MDANEEMIRTMHDDPKQAYDYFSNNYHNLTNSEKVNLTKELLYAIYDMCDEETHKRVLMTAAENLADHNDIDLYDSEDEKYDVIKEKLLNKQEKAIIGDYKEKTIDSELIEGLALHIYNDGSGFAEYKGQRISSVNPVSNGLDIKFTNTDDYETYPADDALSISQNYMKYCEEWIVNNNKTITYASTEDVLSSGSCLEGSTKENYTNRLLILRDTSLQEGYRKPEYQYFYATGGFGCNPDSLGTKVYGSFLYDNVDGQFYRSDFLGVADPAKLPAWASKKMEDKVDDSIIQEPGSGRK